MNVPVELVVFVAASMVTGVGALFTINAHLLLRIFNELTKVANAQALLAQRVELIEKETV